MSTALVLLFTLAAASVIGTFIPQEPVIPTTVAEWRAGTAGPGAAVARVFDALALFDIFGSWWFMTLVVLLVVSLTGCLIPRWRAYARTARRPPPRGHNLAGLRNSVRVRTALPPEQALQVAAGVLRRRRYRVRLLDDQMAAERGHWREGGSLLFHTSFYLLLAGAVIGHSFGFTGQVNVAEGGIFADTRIAYDLAEPGRGWSLDDHRGFGVRLNEFEVSYHRDLTPRDFVSSITILDQGDEVRTEEVRVNHPVAYRGMKLYQARWGMAPRVVVRAGDRVLFDEPVMLSDAGGWVWTGAAKVSVGGQTQEGPAPQMALDIVFLPDAGLDEEGVPFGRSPIPNRPRLIADLWVGQDLGLERPVPAREFNREGGAVVGPPAILEPGESEAMAGGLLTVEFRELTHWSGFQVSHAPGRGLLLLAAGLLLAGLIPSLYSYRRRVWSSAEPARDGSEITLAGVALQRKPAFAEEFTVLSADVERALRDKER